MKSPTRGRLAEAYAELVSQSRSGSVSSPTLRQFKRCISKLNSIFEGYGQQDSQELLRFALDGLSADLNRVTGKPVYQEMKFKKGTSPDS